MILPKLAHHPLNGDLVISQQARVQQSQGGVMEVAQVSPPQSGKDFHWIKCFVLFCQELCMNHA